MVRWLFRELVWPKTRAGSGRARLAPRQSSLAGCCRRVLSSHYRRETLALWAPPARFDLPVSRVRAGRWQRSCAQARLRQESLARAGVARAQLRRRPALQRNWFRLPTDATVASLLKRQTTLSLTMHRPCPDPPRRPSTPTTHSSQTGVVAAP